MRSLRRMSRVLRSTLSDGFFHVSCRGVAGTPVFADDDDRNELFRLLGSCMRNRRLPLYAACVLSTHYHAVVEAQVDILSRAIHELNWRYARYFNRRYSRFGHVFAERFSSRAIEGDDRVFETCAYVLLNPVKAGQCERVRDWPWSYSRYGLDAT
jgi:REP-associated tyrosine transposase